MADGDSRDDPDPVQRRAAQVGTRRSRSAFPPLRGLLPLAAALTLWQVFGDETDPFYPPPSRWLERLAVLDEAGTLWPAIWETLGLITASLAIATVIGTVAGALIGALHRVDRGLSPTLEFARSLPPATIVPVAVLVLGYTFTMSLSVVVFAATWPVLLASRSGMRSMNPLLRDVGRTLKLSKLETIRRIVLPSLVPSVLFGMMVAGPIVLIVTLLVQMLTAKSGIGALISVAQSYFDTAQVYGLVAVSGVYALLITALVTYLGHVAERRSGGR